MNELTDLQICQRIAEIEGEQVTIKYDWDENLRTRLSYGTEFEDRMPEYNPLTDDALWVQLIDKYNVSINTYFRNPSVKQCYIMQEVDFRIVTGQTFSINDLGLKKAACLAIIDSKE